MPQRPRRGTLMSSTFRIHTCSAPALRAGQTRRRERRGTMAAAPRILAPVHWDHHLRTTLSQRTLSRRRVGCKVSAGYPRHRNVRHPGATGHVSRWALQLLVGVRSRASVADGKKAGTCPHEGRLVLLVLPLVAMRVSMRMRNGQELACSDFIRWFTLRAQGVVSCRLYLYCSFELGL